ncbi:MAG: hypothetical protein HY774_09105 [Acidobacteria bacterium]|nr:hypothetical protein [Acidobacteriota bacterium]
MNDQIIPFRPLPHLDQRFPATRFWNLSNAALFEVLRDVEQELTRRVFLNFWPDQAQEKLVWVIIYALRVTRWASLREFGKTWASLTTLLLLFRYRPEAPPKDQ